MRIYGSLDNENAKPVFRAAISQYYDFLYLHPCKTFAQLLLVSLLIQINNNFNRFGTSKFQNSFSPNYLYFFLTWAECGHKFVIVLNKTYLPLTKRLINDTFSTYRIGIRIKKAYKIYIDDLNRTSLLTLAFTKPNVYQKPKRYKTLSNGQTTNKVQFIMPLSFLFFFVLNLYFPSPFHVVSLWATRIKMAPIFHSVI